MRSSIYVMSLMAMMLNAALALPIKLDDVQETAETDDQLLRLLGGYSMETDAVSAEHERVRRTAIEDPDRERHTNCGWDHHADELAHEHSRHRYAGRGRRAAGEDSSKSSSEEHGQGQQQKAKQVPSDSSSEEDKKNAKQVPQGEAKLEQGQPQDTATGVLDENPQPRKRRDVDGDFTGHSSEDDGDVHIEEPKKDDSSGTGQSARRKRSPDEAMDEQRRLYIGLRTGLRGDRCDHATCRIKSI